jgi:hypothetical protein
VKREINPEFWIGDTVYHAVTDEPLKGLVTSITIWPGCFLYKVTWATGDEGNHFGIELTDEVQWTPRADDENE